MNCRGRTLLLALCLFACFLPASARSFGDQRKTVVDMAGRRVLIPQEVRKVITAGGTPAVNAFILAIGKGETIKNGRPPVVMRDNRWRYQTVFAPFLAGQPVVSTSDASVWTPDLEVLATLPHDVVFVDSELTAHMLEEKGFTVISLNWHDPECVTKTMALMGEVFDQRSRARYFERYYRRNLSRVSSQIASVPNEKRPKVLYFRTNPMALIMPSTAGHLIALAGGRYGAGGTIPGSGMFSLEHLIVWDPDVLLVGRPDEVERIYHERCYSQLKAVRNRRVHVVPVGAHVWTNYTPEHAVSVLWLAKLLYPERFRHIDIINEMRDFYGRFFGYRLTDAEINEILTRERR